VLPIALPAPMPVEQLKAMLELAGLSLVQTEPDKLRDAHGRMSREPQPSRVPRERPVLPPPDARPLIQIETRKGQ
jgi:ribonuclease E